MNIEAFNNCFVQGLILNLFLRYFLLETNLRNFSKEEAVLFTNIYKWTRHYLLAAETASVHSVDASCQPVS